MVCPRPAHKSPPNEAGNLRYAVMNDLIAPERKRGRRLGPRKCIRLRFLGSCPTALGALVADFLVAAAFGH